MRSTHPARTPGMSLNGSKNEKASVTGGMVTEALLSRQAASGLDSKHLSGDRAAMNGALGVLDGFRLILVHASENAGQVRGDFRAQSGY